MNNSSPLSFVFLAAAALLAIFWEAAFAGIRAFLGAQIDLLPPLMVYAGLRCGLGTLTAGAIFSGVAFDALSSNPLGTSILPLFIVGFAIYLKRDLILRDEIFAQLIMGLVASAAAPVITLVLLLTFGAGPLIGWGTLWQLFVMSVGGSLATPVFFALFDWLNHAFVHSLAPEPTFRPDRQIRRGR